MLMTNDVFYGSGFHQVFFLVTLSNLATFSQRYQRGLRHRENGVEFGVPIFNSLLTISKCDKLLLLLFCYC
jgi:hypothetical protein